MAGDEEVGFFCSTASLISGVFWLIYKGFLQFLLDFQNSSSGGFLSQRGIICILALSFFFPNFL